jgi:hypothetical protein
MKEKYKNTLYTTLILIVIRTWITTIIQAFKCPSMTQTEKLLRIDNSFLLDFIDCEPSVHGG